ncbi:MAG: hypothetical protein ACYCW6_16990 [Candidatus Xenobia bacterium]
MTLENDFLVALGAAAVAKDRLTHALADLGLQLPPVPAVDEMTRQLTRREMTAFGLAPREAFAALEARLAAVEARVESLLYPEQPVDLAGLAEETIEDPVVLREARSLARHSRSA